MGEISVIDIITTTLSRKKKQLPNNLARSVVVSLQVHSLTSSLQKSLPRKQ